jgi:hypothetical protein
MATSEIKPKDVKIDPATGRVPGNRARADLQVGHREDRGDCADADTPLGWFALFGVAGSGATVLLVAVTWLFLKGVGIWAITQPVAWGFAIINFVWWIGIGHAGTLISAILLLFKQSWRNSISRFAEAMTIFAVVCAGMFPLIHMGRPWLGYWMLPLPSDDECVAAVPLAAGVGRVRGFDVRDHLRGVLVHRDDSRLRNIPRPVAVEDSGSTLRHHFAGVARLGAALDAV